MVTKGAKREMQRAEKTALQQPQRFVDGATCYAMLLFFAARFSEAEDVMRGVRSLIDRVRNHRYYLLLVSDPSVHGGEGG